MELDEEGLRGSRYGATVIDVRGERALVEHREFVDEQGKPEREWYALDSLLRPPQPPPPGWIAALRPGDSAEILHEGGWWNVRLRSLDADECLVDVVGYMMQRRVKLAALRPRTASRR